MWLLTALDRIGPVLWQAKLTFIHNYRYPQFKLWLSKLWISTIRIVDIGNSNPCIDMNPNQIFSLFMAGKNEHLWHHSSASPRGHHMNYIFFPVPWQHLQFLISTIRIVDIHNSNCWYSQFKLSISTIAQNRSYRQFELRISAFGIVDIDCWYRKLKCWYP